MNTEEVFKIIGRLYLESQATLNQLADENEKLRNELESLKGKDKKRGAA